MTTKKRGLANASIETRKRVASLGGKASKGGGRRRKSEVSDEFKG